jgi:hypothetical protein
MTRGSDAHAAEIKVLTSVALTSALDELAPQFERATGNKLTTPSGLQRLQDDGPSTIDGDCGVWF